MIRGGLVFLLAVACSAFRFQYSTIVFKKNAANFNLRHRRSQSLSVGVSRLFASDANPGKQFGIDLGVGEVTMSKEDRITLWAEVEDSETKLQEAIDIEEYSQAAVLRDRIKTLKLRDPYTAAKSNMDRAIAEERYEDAARWRGVMAEVGEPPQKPGKGSAVGLYAGEGTPTASKGDGVSSSDITTLGVRVQVARFFPLPRIAA